MIKPRNIGLEYQIDRQMFEMIKRLNTCSIGIYKCIVEANVL